MTVSDYVNEIRSAWMGFTAHADACATCISVAATIRHEPGQDVERMHPWLCEKGREPFEAWLASLAAYRGYRHDRRKEGIIVPMPSDLR